MKKTLTILLSMSTVLSSFAFAFVLPVQAAAPNWDTTGDYVITMEHLGSDNDHDMTLVQDEFGQLTGNGGSPAGATSYLWTVTSGSVSGDTIEFTADYTATSDAVTPQTTMEVTGTIATDGTMAGNWSDNYDGGDRSGTWDTASGSAIELPTGSMAAEDFAVVSHGTSNGTLSGYTAGFGVSDATMANAQSVVVELYSGATLLQTNTAIIPAFNADVTGTQFSSPFDVSGTFDYAADGYWMNSREAEYGQTLPATKVVATVMLENDKVVTATNTNVTGDPDMITPDATPTTSTVTIEKYVQGVMATAVNADNTDFPMTSTWDASNMGTGTASYTLSETNATPYQAVTSPMTNGADYETEEVMTGDFVGTQCSDGKPFALAGYTTGDTRTEAMNGTVSTTSPSFTDIQDDKFVIVWNRDCSLPEGEIGGDVISDEVMLEVTSIEMVDTTATANGSFADGWEYVFHITAPMNEANLAMKFTDWLEADETDTIPVADNMRISSQQADNAGATILLTAANVYSTPDLHMVDDLDPTMDGRQVEITVEVAIPSGTADGSYTTSYGLRSTE